MEKQVADIVPVPKGRNILWSQFVYDYKIDWKTGLLIRWKARLVACGNTQVPGLDFNETFAPVVKVQSLRLLIAVALRLKMKIEQVDITTAYLNGKLTEINYMRLPPGYYRSGEMNENLCFKLIGSVYGLRQAAREWYKVLRAYLITIGFTPFESDACIFTRTGKDKYKLLLLVYVDDFLIMCKDELVIAQVKQEIGKKFALKDGGTVNTIVGLQMIPFENSTWLGQERYAQEILEAANMWDTTKDFRVDVKPTPMVVGWTHNENSEELSPLQGKDFVSILMKLSYLAQQSRPDILYAVNYLAQYQKDVRMHDWKALMRILKYLRGTHDLGMHFVRAKGNKPVIFTNDSQLLITEDWKPDPAIYADANYGQERERRSRSGHVFMILGSPVFWFSKKQPVIAMSSTEAEYYALSEAVKEAIWMNQIMTELGVNMVKPTTINQDNMSTIAIATNPVNHRNVKHIEVRYHFLRDHIGKGNIKLAYCPTENMVADILTKALPKETHWRLVKLMGLRSLGDINGTSPVEHFKQDMRFLPS
jgi:hypothetical protein